MNTEILGSVLQIVILLVFSYPLGKHIAKVYKGEKSRWDFFTPVENFIYKLVGVDPKDELETIPESIIGFKFSLVFLGNGIAMYPAVAAVKSGREC